jgi:hypothetical protein
VTDSVHTDHAQAQDGEQQQAKHSRTHADHALTSDQADRAPQ